MKKIICFLLFSFVCIISIFSINSVYAECEYNNNGWIVANLDGCLSWEDSYLVSPGDGRIENGIKQRVVYWTNAITSALALLAIGAVVYGWFMMTISFGEDERIKKGKDIVKWSLLWFLAAISTGAIIRLVVEVIFDIAW